MPSRESAVDVKSLTELSDTWHTAERDHTCTPFPSQPGDAPSKFIKRQLHRHKMVIRYDGEPGLGYYNLDRLKNERDAMTLPFAIRYSAIGLMLTRFVNRKTGTVCQEIPPRVFRIFHHPRALLIGYALDTNHVTITTSILL